MEAAPTFVNHSSSTSDAQQSCPDRQHSAPSNICESCRVCNQLSLDAASNISAASFRGEPVSRAIEGSTLWLEADQRYLLIEDVDTGDVLMPLFYLRDVFKANYSRKIRNLNNRLVEKPPGVDLGVHDASQSLFWITSFESPQNIKTVARKALGESTAGHLRLVLLPVVYNTMLKSELCNTALFNALEKAMRQSTYFPLLLSRKPADDSSSNQPPAPPALVKQNPDGVTGCEVDSMDQEGALFSGPKRYAVTAAKYMSPFKEQVVTAKRLKQQQQEQQACEGVSRHPNSEGFVRPPTSLDMYAFDQFIQAPELGESSSALSCMREELAHTKRQCVQYEDKLQFQAAKIQDLEQGLASLKAMMAYVCSRVEDGTPKLPSKLPPEYGAAKRSLRPECPFPAMHGVPQLRNPGSSYRLAHSPGGDASHLPSMEGYAKRPEATETQGLSKREATPVSMRQVLNRCHPQASQGSMLLSGNILEHGPAAITSQLLSLQGPGTPAITSVPNVFGSQVNLANLDLPAFCQPGLGHHNTSYAHLPHDFLSDIPSGTPPPAAAFNASG